MCQRTPEPKSLKQSVVIIMEYASGGTVADLIKERRDLHARSGAQFLMSEVPLQLIDARPASGPSLPDVEQWSRAVAPTSSRGELVLV